MGDKEDEITLHKRAQIRLLISLAELEKHQETTFERLRQALTRINMLERYLKDKEAYVKSLEARVKELEGEMEDMIHPDDLGDYAADRRSS